MSLEEDEHTLLLPLLLLSTKEVRSVEFYEMFVKSETEDCWGTPSTTLTKLYIVYKSFYESCTCLSN